MTNRLIKRFSHSTFAAIALSGSISMSACTFGGQAATALPTVLATESNGAVATTAVPTLAKATVAQTTVPSETPWTKGFKHRGRLQEAFHHACFRISYSGGSTPIARS